MRRHALMSTCSNTDLSFSFFGALVAAASSLFHPLYDLCFIFYFSKLYLSKANRRQVQLNIKKMMYERRKRG